MKVKKTTMQIRGAAVLGAAALVTAALTGCGNSGDAAVTATPSTSTTYFSPAVFGQSLTGQRESFAIDSGAGTFVEYQYAATQGDTEYIANSGKFTTAGGGLLNIGLTYINGSVETGTNPGTLVSSPAPGDSAVEYDGYGGFVGLLDTALNPAQSVVPIVPSTNCPNISTAQKYLFVTLPVNGDRTGSAYGTFSVSTSGTTVSFSGIRQLAINGAAAANPSAATTNGTCSPTFYGQTVSVPNTVTVNNPGLGGSISPAATLAFAPGGMFAEDNGYTTNPVNYQNMLGAGSGAVGFAAPTAAVTTGNVVGARFNGYVYTTGASDPSHGSRTAIPAATRLAGFGFANVSGACPNPPTTATATLIYGGEYTGNNAQANPTPKCDLALDLGVQDPQNNGLYPNATLWVGAGFPRPASTSGYVNQSAVTYSVPAVAIVSQLNGKFAVNVIVYDATGPQSVVAGAAQDWGIYLLQSN